MSINIGSKLKLVGLTLKGKDRINKAGHDIWEVAAIRNKVPFSYEPGPWLLIVPEGCGMEDRLSRWIRQENDINFFITKL